MRSTVVDVPYGAAQDGLFTSTYAQPLEPHQVGDHRRTCSSRVRPTSASRTPTTRARKRDRTTARSSAMFRIQSHFDIRRAYNPPTGEELNVVEENTIDRPWYEREYMRVDWSQEPGHRRLRLRHAVAPRPLRRHQVRADGLLRPRPERPERAALRRAATATSTSPTRPSPPADDRHARWGCVPGLLLPRLSGAAAPVRQLQPDRADAPPLVQEGRRHRLRAHGLGRPPHPGLRRVHQDRYGYDRNYGMIDEQVAPLHQPLQHLGAQPRLRRTRVRHRLLA